MRLALLAALLLAVLLSLPNALAVRSAAVNSGATVAVVATDSALLALAPGTGGGNAAETAYYRNPGSRDALVLDFTRGLSMGISYGFAPNSLTYRDKFRYRGLFTVTNRSDQALCISVYVPDGGVADLDGIYVRSPGGAGTGSMVASLGGQKLECSTWLTAGASFEVDIWWEIDSGSEGLHSFSVRVEGTR